MSEKKGQINLSIDKDILIKFKIRCLKSGNKPSDLIVKYIKFLAKGKNEDFDKVFDIIDHVVLDEIKKPNPSKDV